MTGPFPGRRKLAILLGLTLSVGLVAAGILLARSSAAGRVVTLGHRWPAADLVSMDVIDHRAWDVLLRHYVDGAGRVDYAAWKRSAADLRGLYGYLDGLSHAGPDRPAARGARLAFWINASNAVTVRGILREYPTATILDHAPEGAGSNIWRDLRLVVGGDAYSLGRIEEELLRKMAEPRIHFAIVCGARGCPRLRNEAYTAARQDEQLGRNARDFFADPTKSRYDPATKRLRLSAIADWYTEDFGPDPAARLRRIAPYLPDAAARRLAEGGAARVDYLDYDRGRNGREPTPTAPKPAGGPAADGPH